MNRWRDTSQNINLNLWQKSEELIFKKDYVPDTTTKLKGQPHTPKTVLRNYDSYGLTNPLLVATTMAHMPFHYLNEKKSPSSHSTRGTKKNQTANSKVGFTINPKRGLTNTKKPNRYTQCSFPRKEQTCRTLSERDFLRIMYIGWIELLYLRRHISVI